MEDQPEVIHTFANADIAILRSGKAKKNDPPIPADLAPISGSGKRVKKEEKDDDRPVFLDSIKLKYSEETIAEETSAEEAKPQAEAEAPAPKQNNNRRHKSKKPKAPQGEKPAQQQKTEKPAQQQKAEQPAQQKQENGEGKKSNNRRHYYRHRRGKPSGDKKPQA